MQGAHRMAPTEAGMAENRDAGPNAQRAPKGAGATINDDAWKDFFDHTRSLPPSRLLRQAVRSVRSKSSALDLGSGGLKDSRFLLECGFEKVVALDVVLVAEAVAADFPRDRFTYLKSSFETFDFPVAAFDLINAQFSLPFTDPLRFNPVFERILHALRPAGVFVGQSFGDPDQWAGDSRISFHSATAAKSMRAENTALVYFSEEEDWEGRVASGAPKHWHILNIIARRNED
jgi:tellurite methyltransferase